MVRRISEEIERHIVELGVDGRLVRLQLEELMGGVQDDHRLMIQDYVHEEAAWELAEAVEGLANLGTDDLLDLKAVAAVLHLPGGSQDLDLTLSPRGYRLLSKVPRLPESVVEGIVDHFGSLQKIMRASTADLDAVKEVGDTRARAIKEGLSRLAETSILDRYN
jgi:diadenylate cyclase